jgi:transposase
VYVEDLAVSGLARSRLARSINDAGWSMFVQLLEYKARRYHRTFGSTPVELVSDGTSVPQSAVKQEPAGSAA